MRKSVLCPPISLVPLMAGLGCTGEMSRGLLDCPSLARRLIDLNRARMADLAASDLLPRTDDEWAAVQLEFVPGGIMVWWPDPKRIWGSDQGSPGTVLLFRADGTYINWVVECYVTDVTGDGVMDFVVAERVPEVEGYWWSVYPLGRDYEPIRGFAPFKAWEGQMAAPLRLADFNRDGIAEVVLLQPADSLAGKGWFSDSEFSEWSAWKRTQRALGRAESGPATAVWSFKLGIARPILIFAGDYEWRLLDYGFVVSTEPYEFSPGIPDRALRSSLPGPWFKLTFEPEVSGVFEVSGNDSKEVKPGIPCGPPGSGGGPLILRNERIIDGQRLRDIRR